MVTSDMLDPRQALTMGPDNARRRGILGARPTARAYGSAGAADLEIQSDARGALAAFPGHGGLPGIRGGWSSGSSSFGGRRYPERQQPGAWYEPGGPGGAYGGGWADGVLTVRDRHVITRQGTVRSGHEGAGGSMPSPEKDGPPLREYQMVNTTESWQIGTDLTTNEDNHGVHNTVGALDGSPRVFPLGQQDGSFTRVFGPPLGSWREYGVRGPAGMHGPDPDIWDPNWVPGGRAAGGSGGAGGRGRMVQAGAENMQPQDARFVYGGEPHGLHSPTVDARRVTMARQRDIIQPQPPRQDRPASSRIAGQSFSQTIVPEAMQGEQRPTPRMADPGRTPGLINRFRPRG